MNIYNSKSKTILSPEVKLSDCACSWVEDKTSRVWFRHTRWHHLGGEGGTNDSNDARGAWRGPVQVSTP